MDFGPRATETLLLLQQAVGEDDLDDRLDGVLAGTPASWAGR